MEYNRRVETIIQLGTKLAHINDRKDWRNVVTQAIRHNPWFTESSVQLALDGIRRYMDEEKLVHWLNRYGPDVKMHKDRNVGIIMAGNIPMVGFHDLLCVLLAGHRAVIKLSSKDEKLIPYIIQELVSIEPQWNDYIEMADKLTGYDAVIATGSNNTSRYFKYYFGEVPHIIRSNRTGVAILNGREPLASLQALGYDIFRYFGLGCRNVSKIYIPDNYDIKILLDSLQNWLTLVDHHKYANNYNYSQAIYAMEQIPHLDTGFALFTENSNLYSPTAVVYYEKYRDLPHLNHLIQPKRDNIQCIVADKSWHEGSIKFGTAQQPEVWDYADNVDTMRFLLGI